MGWTSYHATHYKNGKIDKKAECDSYFASEFGSGYYEVVKSAMVGSVYYAAIKELKRYAGKNENGESVYNPIPRNEQRTFAAVFLTSINMRDYFNFSYKDMDETVGPYEANCPKGILNALSPTDNEFALAWRARCFANIDKKKDQRGLNNLPVGTVICVKLPFDSKYFNKGDEVRLEKVEGWGRRRPFWYDSFSNCRFTESLMKQLSNCYSIVKIGG